MQPVFVHLVVIPRRYVRNTHHELFAEDAGDASHTLSTEKSETQELAMVDVLIPFAVFEEKGEMCGWEGKKY